MRAWYRLLLVSAALAGCDRTTAPSRPEPDGSPAFAHGDGGDSDTRTAGSLTFVQFSPAGPPPAVRDTSFWAVKGQSRSLRIDYASTAGALGGERLLEFKVDAESLLRRPDGRLFQQGDSVRITLHVDDATGFVFTFGPSGLRFDPRRPAELNVWYTHADPDLNGDGVVNAADDAYEKKLSLWRREDGETTWTAIVTKLVPTDDKARAWIGAFTSFALASN